MKDGCRMENSGNTTYTHNQLFISFVWVHLGGGGREGKKLKAIYVASQVSQAKLGVL